MRLDEAQIQVSATNLANHLSCDHLTKLEQKAAHGLLAMEYRNDLTLYDYANDSKSFRVKVINATDTYPSVDTGMWDDNPTKWTLNTSIEFVADHHNHTGYTQTLRETTYDHQSTVIKTVDYPFGVDEFSQSVTENSTTTTHIFGHDGHGSVRVLYDLAQAADKLIQQLLTFAAHGGTLAAHDSTGTIQATTAVLTSLGYSGEFYDAAAKQQYLRARFYNPANGRFNRLDPFTGNVRDPQSLHKYAYVHGDAVNGVDPSGRSIFWLFQFITAGTQGAAYTLAGFDVLGPTRTRPEEFYSWTTSKQDAWLKVRWENYGRHIEASSIKHGVPRRPITLVVFNEMMDYSVWERIGEALGFGDSLGPAQLTVSVARANDLLPRHDAVPWKIAEQTADLRANPEAGVNQAIERLRKQRVKDRQTLRDPKENIDIAARLIGIYLKTLKNAMGSVNDGTWGGIPIEVVERALLSANVPSLANAFRSEVSNVIGNPDASISQTLTAAITAMTNNSVSALNPNLLTLDTEKHVANAIGLTQIINAERYRD